jgi:hypothetical protein
VVGYPFTGRTPVARDGDQINIIKTGFERFDRKTGMK